MKSKVTLKNIFTKDLNSSSDLQLENLTSSTALSSPRHNSNELFYIESLSRQYNAQFVQSTVKPYFVRLFQDLVLRSNQQQNNLSETIDRYTFITFVNLPGIVSDRFFQIASKDYSERVTKDSFMQLMLNVYTANLSSKMKLVFEIYNFNQDGIVRPEDVRLILSYIPFCSQDKNQFCETSFSSDGDSSSSIDCSGYDDCEGQNLYGINMSKSMSTNQRARNNEQIEKLIRCVFSNKESINLREFITFNTQNSSEMFISVMSILEQRLPCSNFYFSERQKFRNQVINNQYESTQLDENVGSVQTLACSRLIPFFQPKRSNTDTLKLPPQLRVESEELSDDMPDSYDQINDFQPRLGQCLKGENKVQAVMTQWFEENEQMECDWTPRLATQLTARLQTPTQNLQPKPRSLPLVISRFGNQESIQKNDAIINGTCFIRNVENRLQKYWCFIKGKELYCQMHQYNDKIEVMHCLVNTFVEPAEPYMISGYTLYPVKIILAKKKIRILYYSTQAEQEKWVKTLQKVSSTKNINDSYAIQQFLGSGQFGVVNLATHIASKNQFAVKSILKTKMSAQELFQQRREFEVLKMCQHDNIIKLKDIFETTTHYYVVMEYVQGKDLFEYLQERRYSLTEEQAKRIVWQLIQAVRYLHSYGIVHRDIKLENIIMSDTSDHAIPKLCDFGLSQILGPNQMTSESYGTLGYVAPEVLLQVPYNFTCDVWSIGCILYALISGSLPFQSSKENKMKLKTISAPIKFQEKVWQTTSYECCDLVIRLLAKNPVERITLELADRHSFFDSVRYQVASQ